MKKAKILYSYYNARGLKWIVLYFFRWILLNYFNCSDKPIVNFLENSMINIEEKQSANKNISEGKQNIIKTITFIEFKKMSEKDPYFIGRWKYIHKVIDIIKRENPNSVLELGPNKMPIVRDADTMDIDYNFPGLTYHHDAAVLPWPIEDSKYDMFIALQVWEHLENKQTEAFMEVTRISKKAILSFPYKWHCPGDPHHNIDEERIREWTLNIKPTLIIPGDRIIYYFDFQNSSRST